jgi:phosphoribosylformylglycinamidine synthase PurS subunit
VARIIVEVMLKPEIHDPQGEAIVGACRRLGFGQVTGVRQGKRFEVEIDGPADEDAVTALTRLAGDLLSNPVIEEFTVHVHHGEVSVPSTGNHSNREGSWQEGEISS